MLGENASLTQPERDAVVTAAREAVAGRVPLLSGLAELSTADARRAAPQLRPPRRRGPDGLPEPRLPHRPRRDRRLVQGDRRRRPAGDDLQQPARLPGRRRHPHPRSPRRHPGDRRHQGGDRRHPPRHRPLQRLRRPLRRLLRRRRPHPREPRPRRHRLGLRHDQRLAGRMRPPLRARPRRPTARGARPLPPDDPRLPPRHRGQARPAHQARRAPRLRRPRRRPPAAPAAPRRREGARRRRSSAGPSPTSRR